MLVDDHEMTRHLLRELIGKVAGLAVVAEAAGGESAVETARHTGPDVLVMDISMPKMNGVDVTRQIVAESRRPRSSGRRFTTTRAREKPCRLPVRRRT